MNWILPLFPAEPKLGPVLNPVTHFVPLWFPFLLVFPAAAVDWVLKKTSGWAVWQQGVAAGAAFLAVLLAVQWPFANFLLSPWARNWFFYTHLRDYRSGSGNFEAMNKFFYWERTSAEFATNLALALVASVAMTWLGLHWGRWLRKVRR